MAAPKGNQNAKGNKGGGRKSIYQEKADQELLAKMFFAKLTDEEVQKILKGGNHSLKEMMVAKGWNGNERFILAIFNKLFPDTLILPGGSGEIKISWKK